MSVDETGVGRLASGVGSSVPNGQTSAISQKRTLGRGLKVGNIPKIGCMESPLESVQISLEPFPDFVVPDNSALYHGCRRGPHIIDELS